MQHIPFQNFLKVTDLNFRKCYIMNILLVKSLDIATRDAIIDAQVFIGLGQTH